MDIVGTVVGLNEYVLESGVAESTSKGQSQTSRGIASHNSLAFEVSVTTGTKSCVIENEP